jgi:hypothetical protein
MKYLMAMLFISNIGFAQINDGFHIEPEITCTTGECLFVDDRPIELIEKVDRDGYVYSELNTNSSIIDIIESDSELCFNGMSVTNLENIIAALVGNTNSYYTSGGHFAVESYKGTNEQAGYKITLNVTSDYRPYKYILNSTIKSCGGF